MIAADLSRRNDIEADIRANQQIQFFGRLINDHNPDGAPSDDTYSKFFSTMVNNFSIFSFQYFSNHANKTEILSTFL